MGLLDFLFGSDEKENRKRVFISFAIEDAEYTVVTPDQESLDKATEMEKGTSKEIADLSVLLAKK